MDSGHDGEDLPKMADDAPSILASAFAQGATTAETIASVSYLHILGEAVVAFKAGPLSDEHTAPTPFARDLLLLGEVLAGLSFLMASSMQHTVLVPSVMDLATSLAIVSSTVMQIANQPLP